MSKFIDTSGKATAAIGICARCHKKFPYDELTADRNSPGLRVCRADNDENDPYRQAPRKTEKISLRYPRPDEELT